MPISEMFPTPPFQITPINYPNTQKWNKPHFSFLQEPLPPDLSGKDERKKTKTPESLMIDTALLKKKR
jgi:hypothetical protein